MAKQVIQKLAKAKERVSRWRARHGGPGHPIPEELWAVAGDCAAVHGVADTARALGVDRERLARRVEARRHQSAEFAVQKRPAAPPAFIELTTSLPAREQVVVRLTGRDGEQLELSVPGGTLEVVALLREFWGRDR